MPDSQCFQLARNIRRIGHLDLPGGGQVVVDGDLAYVGHMKPPHGTTIIDVSDPTHPRVVAAIDARRDNSHTHKVRVAGDLMIINVEQNKRHFLRKGERLPALRAEAASAPRARAIGGRARRGARRRARATFRCSTPRANAATATAASRSTISPTSATRELLATRGPAASASTASTWTRATPTSRPRWRAIVGNILVIYDLATQRPAGGVALVDAGPAPGRRRDADLAGLQPPPAPRHARRRRAVGRGLARRLPRHRRQRHRQPEAVGAYNYHPPFPEPTHTVMPLRGAGRRPRIAIAIDEEHDHVHGRRTASSGSSTSPTSATSSRSRPSMSASGLALEPRGAPLRRPPVPRAARRHAGLFDVVRRRPAHRRRRRPRLPEEVGHFIPEPVGGQPAPQSNDVDVDDRGLIYLIDRSRARHPGVRALAGGRHGNATDRPFAGLGARARLHGHDPDLRRARPGRVHRHDPPGARARRHLHRHRRRLRRRQERGAGRRARSKAAASASCSPPSSATSARPTARPPSTAARSTCRRPATRACSGSGSSAIDLYYLHRVDPERADRGHVGAMARLVRGGQGAPPRPLRGRAGDAPPRPRRASDRRAADRVLALDARRRGRDPAACRELGIGFVAYSPLGRGFLTGTDHRHGRAGRERPAPRSPALPADNLARNLGLLDDAARARRGQAAARRRSSRSPGCSRRARTSCRSPAPSGGAGSRRTSQALELPLDAAERARLEQAFPPGITAGERYPPGQLRRVGI